MLNSRTLAKLRKELKKKMSSKTDSNHKESTPREIKKRKKQTAGLIGSLNDYSDSFQRAARDMATGAEIPGNIINGLLSARKYGKERLEQLFSPKKKVFYDPMQCSTIGTSLKNKKQRKVKSVLKESRQALELFVEKDSEKHNAFKYLFTTFPLSISTPK